MQRMDSRSSFETLASQAPQDEVCISSQARLRGEGRGGALSARGASRSARDCNQAGLAAIVENSLLRCRFAILDAVFVKHAFDDRIGRSVVPSRIMIEVESDSRDRASADIPASPPAGSG